MSNSPTLPNKKVLATLIHEYTRKQLELTLVEFRERMNKVESELLRLTSKNGKSPSIQISANSQYSGKVIVLWDKYTLRDSLTQILRSEKASIKLISLSDNSYLDSIERFLPDQIIYACQHLGACELIEVKMLMQRFPRAGIVCVCHAITEETAIKIIAAGARGLIRNEREFSQLPAALLRVSKGEVWCSREVMREVLTRSRIIMRSDVSKGSSKGSISAREQEILQLLAQGETNREIAEKMCVSIRTVGNHVYNIYKKLGLKNRLEAYHYAKAHNLIITET